MSIAISLVSSPGKGTGRSLSSLLAWGLVCAVLVWSWNGAEIRPLDLFTDAGNMADYIRDFFPPDFTDWRLYVSEMAVTIQLAV